MVSRVSRLSAVIFLLFISLPVSVVSGFTEDVPDEAFQAINEDGTQLFQNAPLLSGQEPVVDLSQLSREGPKLSTLPQEVPQPPALPQEVPQPPALPQKGLQPFIQEPRVESPKLIQAASPDAPLPVTEKQDSAANVFDQEGLGYKMSYPADWIYEAPTQYQIVFSGKEGTPAYYSTVSVQNIASLGLGGKHDDVDSVKRSVIDQLNSNSTDVKIYDEKPFSYLKADKKSLNGLEFMVEYTRDKDRFRQWIIVVERGGKEVFHIWSYTSPIEQYDAYSDVARDMLNSWTIK